MRQALIATLVLIGVAAGMAIAESKAYNQPIETVWEHAVKATRDVDFVVVDSKHESYELVMRTKSKISAKHGMQMQVTLEAAGQGATTVTVKAVDEDDAEDLEKPIRKYLAALDARLD